MHVCYDAQSDSWQRSVTEAIPGIGPKHAQLLNSQGISSSDIERDFSRPLFHEAYRNEGVEIPPTLNNPNQG